MKSPIKLAAVAAATAALIAGHTSALAATPGNTVLTGDSVVANPTVPDYWKNKANIKANTGVGCVTDGAIADEIANASGGAHVDQYQCAGASFSTGGVHIDNALRTAAQHGDLNPQTKTWSSSQEPMTPIPTAPTSKHQTAQSATASAMPSTSPTTTHPTPKSW